MKVPRRARRPVLCMALGLTAAGAGFAAPAADEVDRLEAELATLQAKLAELDALRARVQALEQELAELRGQSGSAATAAAEPATGAGAAEPVAATLGPEPAAAPSPAETAPGGIAVEEAGAPLSADADMQAGGIELGGALRFTYFEDSFDDAIDTKRGEAGLDLFRVNADGAIGPIDISAEYRFYPYMQTLHHGWIGYDFDRAGQIQAGVTQVPFGLLPYASHNFWFDVPYYLGFSDDYDLGVKYVHETGRWNGQVAYFKNAELSNAGNLDRYSYDLVDVGADGNEEIDQIDARLEYQFGQATGCTAATGISAERGGIFNTLTNEIGDRWAVGLHADIRCGRWNVQGEFLRYAFSPVDPPGIDRDTITLGAFGGAHAIASRGDVYVANFAYNFPVRWPAIDLLTCYNDYSRLDKSVSSYIDSELNVTGCVINIGPTYTYVDLIRGRNMLFLGPGSLGDGGIDDWETRFNINVGYYF